MQRMWTANSLRYKRTNEKGPSASRHTSAGTHMLPLPLPLLPGPVLGWLLALARGPGAAAAAGECSRGAPQERDELRGGEIAGAEEAEGGVEGGGGGEEQRATGGRSRA